MSQDPFEMIQEADTLFKRGNYKEALELLERAEKSALKNERNDELAAVYSKIGKIQRSLGENENAKTYFEQSLKIFEQLASIDSVYFIKEVITQNDLGTLLRDMGRFEAAKIRQEEAVKISEGLLKTDPDNIQFQSVMAGTLTNFSTLLSDMGRLEEAKNRFEQALKIYDGLLEKEPDNVQYQSHIAITWNNFCTLLMDMGKREEAEDCYDKTLKMYEKMLKTDPDNERYRSDMAGTLNNLGLLKSEMGRFGDAMVMYEQALKVREELLKKYPDNAQYQSHVAETQNNLGNLLQNMGKLEKSKISFDEALKICEELLKTDPDNAQYMSNVAMTQNNLGNLLRKIGRFKEAEISFDEALKIRQKLRKIDSENIIFQTYVATTLTNLGTLLSDMGRSDEEKNSYEEALKIYDPLLVKDPGNAQYKEYVAAALTNLATALSDMGRLEEAKIKFDKALKIYDSLLKADSDNVNYQSHIAKIHNNLGIILRKEGNFPEALRCHSKALDLSSISGNPDLIFRILYFRGFCHETMGNIDHAYKDYRESIEQIELIRSQFSLEEYKLDILGGKERVYSNMISLLCVKRNDACEAWEYVGRAKSRTLLDYLRLIEFPAPESIPEDLRSKEKELLEYIRALDSQSRVAEKTGQISLISQKITKLQTELGKLYDQIKDFAPEYVDLRKGRPLLIDEITDLPKEQGKKAAFLEYYTTPEKVFIFVIHSNSNEPIVKIVDLPYQQLTDYVNRYSQEIANYQPGMEETWLEAADYLIVPVIESIKGCEILYLIPHGILHYLPLHALLINGKRLIEYFPVVYASSMTGVKFAQRNAGRKLDSCLSAGFTPNENEKELFEGEASLIASLFNTEPWLGKDVNCQLLTDVDKDVVHLSCHGLFDSQDPLNSGLQLSDRIFTVRDIFSAKIKADLLVLSACQTGLNEQKPGDELIGFTRAFFYSGIKSIVVSLWSVSPDSTLKLMGSFYKKIKAENICKAEALQKAQIEVMRNEQYSHPYYWSPFILIGDWK